MKKIALMLAIAIIIAFFGCFDVSVSAATVDKPVLSRLSGNYSKKFYLEISAQKNAKIYYTLDGTVPNKKSSLYSEPILIEKNTTLTAVAVKNNKRSESVSAKYVFVPQSPEISLKDGIYYQKANVKISAVDGAEIYYTLDGSSPNKFSSKTLKYSGKITLKDSCVLQAVAYKNGVRSNITTRSYVIFDEEPLEKQLDNPVASVVMNLRSATNDYEKQCTYSWYDGINSWTYSLDIPIDVYQKYRQKTRPMLTSRPDYAAYARDKGDDRVIANIVSTFKQGAAAQKYSETQFVYMMIRFVQSIDYVSDFDSTGCIEYPKYTLETLYDMSGDCEDTTILLAAMLKEAGYDVVLLMYPLHMTVGLKCSGKATGTYFSYKGAKYYNIETTSYGWNIGQNATNDTSAVIIDID